MEWHNEYYCSNVIWHCLQMLMADPRIGPSHVCLFLSLLVLSGPDNREFPVYKDRILKMTRLSAATFHRGIYHLQRCGYLCYSPSFDPKKANKVMLNF
jgi:hypothetical protein